MASFCPCLSRTLESGFLQVIVSNLCLLFTVPYSWDEPTLLPELSVGVQGAGSYMQYNMQDLGGGERLYYYNPIYVVFAHTFSR